MSTNSPTTGYSAMYSVDKYDKLCKSYAVRSGIIPTDDKAAFIKFITKNVVFHGGLAGPLFTISSYFARKLRVISEDLFMNDKLIDLANKLGLFEIQRDIWMSLFMFSNTCCIYFPKQTIKMKCPECNHEYQVNSKNYEYPFTLVGLAWEQDLTRRITSSGKVSSEEKRQHPKQYGIKCTCPACQSVIMGPPQVKWVLSSLGTMMVLNPLMYEVSRNDIGLEKVIIDPKYYEGRLGIGRELEYFDIEGMPWNLVITYASGEMVYEPDEQFYSLLHLNNYVSMGTAGAAVPPVISSVSDLISIDIYKMGNEGLAFSKIDPLYMVSPTNVSGAAFEGNSHTKMRDFVVSGIKAHQEGDINRILYSPAPMNTSALFGDGKRFMSINELMTMQGLVLGAMGMSTEALNGSSGFAGDPVKFSAWNKIMGSVNAEMLDLLDTIFRLVVPKYNNYMLDTEKKKERPKLWMKQLGQTNGGMDLEVKMDLVRQGKIPIDETLDDLGMPSMAIWRSYLKATTLDEERFQTRLSRDVAKLYEEEASREGGEEGGGTGANMHVAKQQIEQEAEGYAQELMQMDDGARKSRTEQLKVQDFVLYSVVIKKLDILHTQQRQQAESQMQQ